MSVAATGTIIVVDTTTDGAISGAVNDFKQLPGGAVILDVVNMIPPTKIAPKAPGAGQIDDAATKSAPKSPDNFVTPTNSPATPKIPNDYITEAARNGKGVVHRKPGTTGDANTVRIMEPTKDYPNGYSVSYNEFGQPINPATGKPGTKAETHVPLPSKE